MPIVRLRLLAVAALALCLGLPTTASAQGASKEFKEHNLKWTLPADWEFRDVAAGMKAGGHLIEAVSPTNDILARAFAQGTDLAVSERASEIKSGAIPAILKSVKGKKIVSSTLSGVECQVVVAQGKFKNGLAGHVRYYVMSHRGKLYHLEIWAYNGAHFDQRDALNELRKGFRLIKGAKKQDKDEKFEEFGTAADADDDDDDESSGDDDESSGDDDESGDGDDDDWPANGPKRDGKKLIFEGLNSEWSLEGLPMRWKDPIDDIKNAYEITKTGVTPRVIVECVGRLKREKKEDFQKDEPDWNVAHGFFRAFKVPFGIDSSKRLRSTRLQEGIQRSFNLGEIKSSQTRVREEVRIGNVRKGKAGTGYMLKIVAPSQRGGDMTIMHFEVQLKGFLYTWQFALSGHTDAYKTWGPILWKNMGKHVRFPDNVDNIAGPIVPPEGLATYSGERGKLITKEKGKTRHAPGGITFKVPVGMYDLDAAKRGNPDIRFGVEWRSSDGKAYVYFDVHTWPAEMLQRQQMSIDTKADKRVGAWESGAGDEIKLSKSGKKPYLKKGGSLLRFKGKFSYRFEAKRGDTPYVEEGCWGKQKTYIVWSRIQYGGIDAQKHKEAKKIVKAIKKGLKLK